jgi:hypothetical protein
MMKLENDGEEPGYCDDGEDDGDIGECNVPQRRGKTAVKLPLQTREGLAETLREQQQPHPHSEFWCKGGTDKCHDLGCMLANPAVPLHWKIPFHDEAAATAFLVSHNLTRWPPTCVVGHTPASATMSPSAPACKRLHSCMTLFQRPKCNEPDPSKQTGLCERRIAIAAPFDRVNADNGLVGATLEVILGWLRGEKKQHIADNLATSGEFVTQVCRGAIAALSTAYRERQKRQDRPRAKLFIVDETQVGHANSGLAPVWYVVGVSIDLETQRIEWCVVEPVKIRDSQTLREFVARNVQRGGEVWTDSFKSYVSCGLARSVRSAVHPGAARRHRAASRRRAQGRRRSRARARRVGVRRLLRQGPPRRQGRALRGDRQAC